MQCKSYISEHPVRWWYLDQFCKICSRVVLVATFIQEVNFLMKLRTDTKNLFHRRLVQCYSCSLAGLLTFMI